MQAKRKAGIVYTGIVVAVVVLNIAAWNSTAFCDAYITYVFPVWVNTYGRITGLFPFSIGEWLIAAGVILVTAVLLFLPILAIACIFHKNRWKRWLRKFYTFFAWALAIVCLVMTLNCFILYHASTFSEKYFGQEEEDYSIEELITFRNYVVQECNRLSGEVERDYDGNVMFSKGLSEEKKRTIMQDTAREAMRKLGKTYPQLDGWYPRPKPMLASDFMCQMYMQGYYFPFSMEANYNDVMEDMRKPATLCHELAHLRGYIYEDEANFISYLACTESQDICFQYSGYLSVLNYLDNDLYNAMIKSPEAYEAAVKAQRPLIAYGIVREDNIFVSEEEWERINGKALLDTETVDEVSDTVLDATLKVNGVSDGAISYSRVVRLLLQYYRLEKG